MKTSPLIVALRYVVFATLFIAAFCGVFSTWMVWVLVICFLLSVLGDALAVRATRRNLAE